MSTTDNKTEQSQDSKKKKSKKQKPTSGKHHHHHHRRRPREETLESLKRFKYDMPGVHRIVLSEKTQADIGMVVGEDVTSELPWKIIQKEVIADHIELIENSEFIEFRLEVIPYESPDVLMGYIPDEIREYDEFYLVLSQNAQDTITNVITKIKAFQEAKLTRALEIVPRGFWPSFGSEDEIAEYTETPNRNLYEVEVETSYPIISRKVKFRIRPVENARDGYMELLTRLPIQNVIKSRIDAIVQRSPTVITREAQTNCPYPKNAWTQYFYEFEPVTNLTAKFTQNIRDFVDFELDDLCDKINVNDHINLYSNDYRDLVTDQAFAETPERVSWDEYMSFADLKDARNKMITSACWHPMLTGTVAISYADKAPNTFLRGPGTIDPVNNIIHGKNPILVWCFNDGLYPKLELECPRPADCISFCPFDPNIIVGALSNGQVVVWDIKNKLEHVEEQEILTQAQQKYRVLMFSLMDWFQNTHDIKLVRVTAQSDMAVSHSRNVTRINWINPFRRLFRTGKIVNSMEDEPMSMQFSTSSIDGSLFFWDMLAKPAGHAGEHQKRRSKRLKVRPSALTLDFSPFRFLNRLWRPLYKITVSNSKKNRGFPIASSDILAHLMFYEKADPKQPDSMTERVVYKPVWKRPTKPHSCTAICGTSNGYVYMMKWDGYEVDPGEPINTEYAKVISIGRYHDGPVHTMDRNAYSKTTFLSIGGRIFAIWRPDLKDRPILWRKSRVRYLHGHWAKGNPSMFRLSRRDGSREVWSLLKRSDKKMYEQNMSGERVLGSYVHHRVLPIGVIGIADNNGAFRMFYIPHLNQHEEAGKKLELMLDREVIRKKAFMEWQSNWLDTNKDIVEQRLEYRRLRMEMLMEKALKEQQKKAEEKAEQERAQKLLEKKSKPEPGHYQEWAQEQVKIKEEERMKRVLLLKKQLDPELLVSQQAPLKKLAQEEEKKKKRQKERLAEADKLFSEGVATLFPDVIKVKPPPPLDPYEGDYPEEETVACFAHFAQLHDYANTFVQAHPFTYNFDWKRVVQSGIERRKQIYSQFVTVSHRERYETEKRLADGGVSIAEVGRSKILSTPSGGNINEEEDEGEEEGDDLLL